MIRPGVVWGIARAEARLTRRLVRYWLFVVLSTLVGAINFLNLWFIHHFFSSNSASAAAINPRFFIAGFAANFLLVFLFGLVFLGFDVRARDQRERMSEVLDALPCSNVELLLGKYVGILMPAWIAVAFISGLLLGVSHLVKAPIEPRSLLSFVFFLAPPAFMFTLGLVFLLSLLVRHRLIAAMLSLAVVIGGFIVTLWWIPLYATPFVDVTGGYSMPFPSDLVGSVMDFWGLLQRLGFAVGGVALLLFAAAIHPRNDEGSRVTRAGTGGVALLLALALVGSVAAANRASLGRLETWKQAHEQRTDDPSPDLLTLRGTARVDPGSNLELDLELSIAAPPETSLDSALFTLNPGLTVREVTGESGAPLEFTHENGLLQIRLPSPLEAGGRTTLALAIEGEPSRDFAYLDASMIPLELTPTEAQLVILGYEPRIWDSRYVALLPGIAWLPGTGADVGRGASGGRPADFYELDLTVELPEGWLAAGPGRRAPANAAAGSGRVAFRYAPPAPVPGVALLAAPFESRTAEVEGVQVELLISSAHASNAEFFDDASVEIGDWLSEHLKEAEEMGLPYPYDGLTLVEIPLALRGFGGGWRMDSTMMQPAVIMMRETSLPTAYFQRPFRDPERFRDQEGGIPRAKREMLERFFEADLNGGNPFVAAARSFFGFQTSATGRGGMPLDHVFEAMATRLLTDKEGYFSVHLFDNQVGQAFQRAGMQMNSPDRISDNFTEVMVHMLTSTPKVWDTILETSLSDLDPWEDPERAINVLSLKGGAMAESLLDGLGRERAGALLATLRDSKTGGNYTRADVALAAEANGEDLERWLDVWLDTTELPGFTAGDISLERVADDEDGSPRYQVLATIRNDEATDGLIRIDYRAGDRQSGLESGSTEPVLVLAKSSLEMGVVTSKPPRMVRVVPYLALNRDSFSLSLPPVDEERIVEAEPFSGSREVEWEPESGNAIVVDDLDPGFSVAETSKGSWLRVAQGSSQEVDTDQGLPVAQSMFRPAARWSRRSASTAYGKYRHTMAIVKGGNGERRASFSAEIPRAGEWELEYHLPSMRRRGGRSGGLLEGSWYLTVVDSSGTHEVTFDLGQAEPGWNSLGSFEIADGEVRVEVSDETEGRVVVADAIRWVPTEVAEIAEAQ